jgi:hypothetical protein
MANRPTGKTAEQEQLENTLRAEQANSLPEGRTLTDVENEQRQYVKDPNEGTGEGQHLPNTIDPNLAAKQDLINERAAENLANMESDEGKQYAEEQDIIEKNRTMDSVDETEDGAKRKAEIAGAGKNHEGLSNSGSQEGGIRDTGAVAEDANVTGAGRTTPVKDGVKTQADAKAHDVNKDGKKAK